MALRSHRLGVFVLAGLVAALAAVSAPGSALAQPYTQLQVLLPGETAAPGTVAGKTGTPDPQTVGVPFSVTVRACDPSWYTVTSIVHLVSLSSTDASATLPGPSYLAGGEATVTVTLHAAGSFRIAADDETDPTIPSAESAAVTLVGLDGFEFSRITQKNQYAGVPMSITLTAVDPAGNPVSGFFGAVALKEITSYGEGRISPDRVVLSEGQWSGSVTLYRADETSISRGNVNIQAYLEADPTRNGTSDPFTVHPGPFARLQIVLPGESPLPGSVSGLLGAPAWQAAGQTFAVDIYGTDEYWNPVPASTVVRVTSSDPLASTPGLISLSEGYAHFLASLGTVGAQTITVTDQTSPSVQGMTSSPITVIPSAPDHFVIDPFPVPVVAGEEVNVTIHATDVAGNPIPDFNGSAILTANTGPGTISPEVIVFAGGTWNGPVVLRGAGGSVSFTCSDYASPPHTGTSAAFQVLPGPFSGLQLLLPGQTPQPGTSAGYTGSPAPQDAGGSFTVMVRAVDLYWNRVPGIRDRIALSSSDPSAELPQEASLADGELRVPATLFRAGSHTLTVASLDSAGMPPRTSSAVEVAPGAYAGMLLLAPGETPAPGMPTGRSGSPTDQSITIPFRIEIYATDAWWNPVTGVADLIRITSTDPLAELPADSALTDGYLSLKVRLASGGFQLLTATNLTRPAVAPSTTQVRMISSGFHLEAEVAPTEVRAGEPFVLTVRVTNDAGSVITEMQSTVSVEVQNASTGEPGHGTLALARFQLISGERTVSETYTLAEPIILIISDDAGNEPAVSDVVTVTPGLPAAVRLASDPPWVRGNRHALVTARVVDAYENGVPAQPIAFALLSGGGILTPTDSVTAADGTARADFLAPRTPGISRLRASSGALAAEADLETALVDPSLPGGTVTNYPNPFHPGEGPTTIAYKLDADATVRLSIYTLSGNLVLQREFGAGAPGGLAGLNEFAWDGRNGRGSVVSSGGYIVHIRAEGTGETLHDARRQIAVVR